jgi:hypothetical protein
MKSPDEVKAFYKNATVNTNPAADATVLKDALQAGKLKPKRRAAQTEPSLWRAIMKNRTTKLATAAVILVTVIVSLSRLGETTVEAMEITEITKAMERVPWLRMTPSRLAGEVSETERWFGFESKILAVKWAGGDVDFVNVKDHRSFTYDPSSNTITIQYRQDAASDFDLTSPMLLLDSLHNMLAEQGARVTAVRMGDYQGHRVQIQEISHPDLGKSYTLYIDPQTKRLCAGKVVAVDAAGNVTTDANLDFDYPPTGPQSIYDLQVPRNARVVDMTPSPDVEPVWEEYLRRKAELPDEYIAVIMHQTEFPSDTVQMLDVDYRSGRKERSERYYPHSEMIADLGLQHPEEIGGSMQTLMAWARSRYDDPNCSLWLQFDDGRYSMKIYRDIVSGWGKFKTDIRVPMTLPQAWPPIPPTSEIIEDDYARQSGLICIESLTQGRVTRDSEVSNPGRFLYYLDPAHDYLCRRQVMEWRPDADWQQDNNWRAHVDPDAVGGASMLVSEITEVLQTPNGHWYPRVIIEKEKHADSLEDYKNTPLKVTDVKTIYLDVSPTFPEGVFDVHRLPGQ